MPKRTKSQHRAILDVVAVLLLSITAVLTAWCGFQASKWGGEMSVAFSQASSGRIQATDFDGEARDARMFDLVIYSQYVVAVASDDTRLADHIEARFTPHFAIAFDAWQADGWKESGPFANKAYVPPGTLESQKSTELADQKFA